MYDYKTSGIANKSPKIVRFILEVVGDCKFSCTKVDGHFKNTGLVISNNKKLVMQLFVDFWWFHISAMEYIAGMC